MVQTSPIEGGKRDSENALAACLGELEAVRVQMEGTLGDQLDAPYLVMHLIAAHHGRARPYFPMEEALDPERTGQAATALAIETPRRFARLQRKYGWWYLAWLENLLRCADALASADQDAEDEPADTQGDKP